MHSDYVSGLEHEIYGGSLKKYGKLAQMLAENADSLYKIGFSELKDLNHDGILEQGFREVSTHPHYEVKDYKDGLLLFMLDCSKKNWANRNVMQFLRKIPVAKLEDQKFIVQNIHPDVREQYEIDASGHVTRVDEEGKPNYILYGSMKINPVIPNSEKPQRMLFFEYNISNDHIRVFGESDLEDPHHREGYMHIEKDFEDLNLDDLL